jgi:hypothetical protein
MSDGLSQKHCFFPRYVIIDEVLLGKN